MKIEKLKYYCNLPTDKYKNLSGFERVENNAGFYLFQDNQSDILAVAHLDTYGLDYGKPNRHFVKIKDRIYSASLDDRLGVYTILSELSDLSFDILLTTNEEIGRSTAVLFNTAKQYNWIFQFDRAGVDVVMYQYEDFHTVELLEEFGYVIGIGTYSDIADLEHLDCKAFNFGTAYYCQHSPYAYMNVTEYKRSISRFRKFYNANKTEYLEHYPTPYWYRPKSPLYLDSDYEQAYTYEEFDYEKSGYVKTTCELCFMETWTVDNLCDACFNKYYS